MKSFKFNKPPEFKFNKQSKQTEDFYQTQTWRKLRNNYINQNPNCRYCQHFGILNPATDVDHIRSIKNGGDKTSLSNLQPLCEKHHSVKSNAESRNVVDINTQLVHQIYFIGNNPIHLSDDLKNNIIFADYGSGKSTIARSSETYLDLDEMILDILHMSGQSVLLQDLWYHLSITKGIDKKRLNQKIMRAVIKAAKQNYKILIANLSFWSLCGSFYIFDDISYQYELCNASGRSHFIQNIDQLKDRHNKILSRLVIGDKDFQYIKNGEFLSNLLLTST